MKKLLKMILITIGVISTIFTINTAFITNPTFAKTEDPDSSSTTNNTTNDTTKDTTNDKTSNSESCRSFLGMPSWDCNLPDSNWSKGEKGLKDNVKQIAVNIADAIIKVASYIAVGFVIYGGYLYIFSSGDPTKAASGKKTISRALIGLAVVGLAYIIVNSASIAILGSSGGFDNKDCINNKCVTPENLVRNMLNWIIGIAGVVAAIYVVIGGIGYVTSAGDPNKLQKSKTTIIYALIGLAIVGLSLVITNNGVDIILAANHGDDIRTPITSLLNSVIGFLGIVAVIFVIKGGFTYMTSNGDSGKLKSAKDTILYACIGLIVCALAFAIVNWAIGAINGNSSNDDKTNESSLLTTQIGSL